MTKKKYLTPCINVLVLESAIMLSPATAGEAIDPNNTNNNFTTGGYASGNGWINNSPTGGIRFEEGSVDQNTGELSW